MHGEEIPPGGFATQHDNAFRRRDASNPGVPHVNLTSVEELWKMYVLQVWNPRHLWHTGHRAAPIRERHIEPIKGAI